MTIKSILVPIGNPERARDSLAVALGLAKRFGAHVRGLHVKPDPKEMLPYATLGLSASMAESVRAAAGHGAEGIAAAALALFEEECAGAGVLLADKPSGHSSATASLLVETGRSSTILAERGRLSDLIVARRPDKVHPTPPQLESMLRESGRPVLLVPPGTRVITANTIALGWNCSSEAASAMHAAMPLLSATGSVRVLTTRKRAGMRPSADDVVSYLGWHGIAAESKVMDTSSRSVGAALLEDTAATGADLIVIGSYSRRRLREMIMGGVTRYVLEKATLPVLMVH